jgi:hypothetical protein
MDENKKELRRLNKLSWEKGKGGKKAFLKSTRENSEFNSITNRNAQESR